MAEPAPPPIGDNKPPGPTETYQPKVDALLRDLTRLVAAEPSAAVASQLRDVVGRATDLRRDMDADKAKDKQPHFDANNAIEASYRPLVDDADKIKKEARRHIDAFLLAEEQRRAREALEARRIADAKAAQAAEAARTAETAPDPVAVVEADDAVHEAAMANHAADHAERRADAGPRVGSATGMGRATSLRTYYSAKITDRVEAAKHFAMDPGVGVAIQKAADAMARATKGSQPIPGCEIVTDRRSA